MGTLTAISSRLPVPLTSFVGREDDLAQIASLLRPGKSRLVTLTGVGGSGKTRLALEFAGNQKTRFKDRVWLVELAALNDPHLLPLQVAQQLGLRSQPDQTPLETLVRFLINKPSLLILDNCEHILEACAFLAENLLKQCPDLVILVTSRESLRAEGETLKEVAPLKLPPEDRVASLSLAELAENEAIRLFLERSQAINPEIQLTEQNRAAVVQLCQTLDGLPLALELAAVRLRSMSVTHLANRLQVNFEARFQLLDQGRRTAPHRHQTLQNLLQWSYERLSEREQVVLRRMGVFAGGFTLEGAEAVGQGPFSSDDGQGVIEPQEVFNTLSELVNKSLVQIVYTSEFQAKARYRMLETIRQYCITKAVQAREIDNLYPKHLEWCVQTAEKAAQRLQGPEQVTWLNQLETEHPNFRQALGWALENDTLEEALRLGGALWRFWQLRSFFEEGRYWLQRILTLVSTKQAKVPPQLKARALEGAGVLFSIVDYKTSLAYHEEALQIQRELGDIKGLTNALKDIGWLALHFNDFSKAKTYARESLGLARRLGDKEAEAAALFILVIVACFQEELDLAQNLCKECLVIWQELGDTGSIASAYHQEGIIALRQKDFLRAQKALQESLKLTWQLDNKLGLANTILYLIELGVAQPHQPQGVIYAVSLLGWLDSLTTTLEGEMPPLARQSFDASLKTSREKLDEKLFQELWTGGKDLTFEQAFQLASHPGFSSEVKVSGVEDSITPLPAKDAGEEKPAIDRRKEKSAGQHKSFEKLTARESEVLRLAVDGLTNAQIAQKLYLSSRTVNAHLTSIYAKLGVTSRLLAIRYVLEHKPD